MKQTLYLLSLFALASSLQASVPLRWPVETSRVQPAQFDAYHGETLDLEASFLSYGSPLALPADADCRIFWQTNGMGSVYWSTNAVLVSSNTIAAVFRPTFDPGATTVLGFLGIPASNYRAAFTIRFRGSPGATPFNPPPVPQAEYYTKPEVDSRIGSATNAIRRVDGAVRPLPPYLHALDFDDSYPEDAAWYYAQPQDYGSCSARRVGNLLERNYDWRFDDSAEFVVRVSAASERFASIGVANVGTNLTEEIATSGKWSRYYKCLPGRVVDGINENGVVCEVNVLGGEPPASTGGDIHPLAAVRWALDNGTSAGMVASNLAARVSFPAGWSQNFHWMIADAASTWIVENGSAHDVTDGVPVMTNFRLYPNRDTSGAGQERYDLLLSSACSITNAWYTRAYSPLTSPAWMSEFNGSTTLYAAAANLWNDGRTKELHRGESYEGYSWWQTVHTSIYDITNRVLRVAVQENDDWYTFAVPSAGTDEDEVRRIAGEVVDEKMPVKWALSNVTNAQGQVVNAEDVGAYAVDETIRVNGAQVPYGNRAYSTYGAEGVVIKPEEVGGRTGGGWLKWNELKLGGDGDSRTGDALTLKKTNGLFNFTIAPAVGSEFAVYLPTRGGNIALTSDIPAPYVPSAADPTFSNEVNAAVANYAAVSKAAMNAISTVTNADANLIYTITSDGAEPRFYFTPIGAINAED